MFVTGAAEPGASGNDLNSGNSIDPRTPSQRSRATANTISASASSRVSDLGGQNQECQAEGVHLKKRRDQKLESGRRQLGNDVWHRLADYDGRLPGMGGTNQFDDCDWMRLCSQHAEKYDDWLLAQLCTIQGCMKDRSGTVVNGTMSIVRTDHMESGSYAPSNQNGSMEDDLKHRPTTAQAKTREVDEGSALNRVMELQNRAMTRGRSPRRKKQPESDG